jgi:hypothetical protein
VEEIVALEDAGHVVDLASGDILWGGAGDTFSPTVIGEAALIVAAVERGVAW